MKPRHVKLTIIATALAAPAFAFAAGDKTMDKPMDKSPSAMEQPHATPPASRAASDPTRYSDRAHMKEWSSDKKQLEQALSTGQDKAYYRQELEKLGYVITALNKDKPDYLEYEIVKGNNSYEVQIDFDKKTHKSTKVDVTTNVWKADATERVLKDANYKSEYPKMAAPDADRYSDRVRMKGWTSEKDRLEKSLKTGQPKDYYPAELKRLGYQVTAVNDRESDYVEYEIVKGDDSYEVQIDLDGTGKAKKVDVTTNLWEADATDRAKAKGSNRK
jgi:uncharacterized protein YmfQ (DUF2313 family)